MGEQEGKEKCSVELIFLAFFVEPMDLYWTCFSVLIILLRVHLSVVSNMTILLLDDDLLALLLWSLLLLLRMGWKILD
jgi:hypothetical protein